MNLATPTLYDFTVRRIDGQAQALAAFRGQVLLVVNTASACGFTPQYAGLEDLHRQYGGQGLVVMGFPCNQFGAQEPGSHSEIETFCETRFGVSFPLMEKVDVNGDRALPLYQWLKAQAPGFLGTKSIKWNFTKFLVGRDGRVIRRYPPTAKPEKIRADIEKALAQPAPAAA